MDELGRLRKKVDAIDDQILKALCERTKICKAIGEVKKTRVCKYVIFQEKIRFTVG